MGRGVLPADLDLDHAVDLAFPFWYRVLVRHAQAEPAQAAGHVDQLLHDLRNTGA
jgi:hypothetical protein